MLECREKLSFRHCKPADDKAIAAQNHAFEHCSCRITGKPHLARLWPFGGVTEGSPTMQALLLNTAAFLVTDPLLSGCCKAINERF